MDRPIGLKRFLTATPDPETARVVAEALGKSSRVEHVLNREAMLRRLPAGELDLLFVDIGFLESAAGRRPEEIKRELKELWALAPQLEIIVLTDPARIRDAVGVVKAGAGNYLTYPLNRDELRYVLESLYESLKVQLELDYFRDEALSSDAGDPSRLARLPSQAMQHVYEKVRLVASTDSTVLLTGETGTGKGVCARLIHALSPRAKGPFIAVNCGAMSDELVQSELFGHEKGSFTGAVKRRLGKFELAAGGTIFLDEIGTVSPTTQIKLLHVLQDKVMQRLGGESDIPVDVRVIAATNAELKSLTEQGAFRTDLYYRLNVFPIEVPPLRERTEDIAPLVDHFLAKLRTTLGKEVLGAHPMVLEALSRYAWPGNVRELENLVERAFILESSHMLTPESFPADLFSHQVLANAVNPDLSLPLAEVRRRAVEASEHAYLRELLSREQGRIGKAAQRAGVTPRQLRNLLAKHGLRKEEYRRERGERGERMEKR